MTRHAHTAAGGVSGALVSWLATAALGPAVVAVPVNLAADALVGAAQRWFKRLRGRDDLSRLVKEATGTTVELNHAEFVAVRKLLEDKRTWKLLGRGTVEELAGRMRSVLPPRDGRTAEDSRAAALTIATGLLEFALADLEPVTFQRLVMARLDRMETNQASSLEKALFGLQSDLFTHFADVIDQFKRVLERLPGPAGRGEITIYLQTLIAWLNADLWPHWFGDQALAPAAIERELGVRAADRAREQDADVAARQCQRLVILGGPGSGKTWLAERTARICAEEALQALAAGATLDEVELPLYVICSRLASAGGDIREAVVCSAFEGVGDLGGSRITKALREFFTERNAPTLLVIDSLDEARDADERLRQADSLPPPWRIVLTSRQGSWNRQLSIREGDDSHRVAELQPLRYPDDVEAFIQRWFGSRPKWGKDLAAQIAQRPDLQQSATVPLILAFYCILGGGQPLPDLRRDLYTRVLRRILTGRWRGSDGRKVDADTCLHTLRAWAWAGTTSHPVSDVGAWADDIPTERDWLDEAHQDALDHVAAPFGLPDIDRGKSLRRFIHRSIREYLVAEHVASLPLDQAAEALLPHLWYDPDWEHAAPAAIAMHPDHDYLLQDLMCRAARSDQIPTDLSVIDAGWEFRRLLARIAAESNHADWSPDVAAMIGGARVELAQSGRIDDLGGAAHWDTSNRQAREALLRLLARETNSQEVARLVPAVTRLATTEDDKRQARQALLKLLDHETNGLVAAKLVPEVARLDPTAQDKRQGRKALLALLVRLARGDRVLLVAGIEATMLTDAVTQLDATPADKHMARQALLWLTGVPDGLVATGAADGLARLDPPRTDKQQAREALLTLLESQNRHAALLAYRVAQLDPPAADRRRAREALLGLLADENNSWESSMLAETVAETAVTAADKRQARQALLGLLTHETNSLTGTGLAYGLAKLNLTTAQELQARQALLRLLAQETNSLVAEWLAGKVAELATAREDRRQAREALLKLLARENNGDVAVGLATALAKLNPAAAEELQARQALLKLLARENKSELAVGLASRLAMLNPTAAEELQARQALLKLLAWETDNSIASSLTRGLAMLNATAAEELQAHHALLKLLARESNSEVAGELASVLAMLNPAAPDEHQARQALLELLARETDKGGGAKLQAGLAQLNPTVDDLITWHAWTFVPTVEVLAAVRRNSALAVWLTALPSLTALSS